MSVQRAHILTLDIGGAKTTVCRFSRQGMDLLEEETFPTDARLPQGDPRAFGNALVALIRSYCRSTTRAVGVSFNAAVDRGVVLASSRMENPRPVRLQDQLERQLGIPVMVANDILCHAEAEAQLGVGRTSRHAVLLNLGTGLRVIQIVEGRVTLGLQSCAGAVTLLQTSVDGIKGKRMFRWLLAGKGLSKLYADLGGRQCTAQEVCQRARRGERRAQRALSIFAQALAQLLTFICAFYDPDVVVTAGSLFKAQGLFLEEVLRRWHGQMHPVFRLPRLVASSLKHGPSRGAAIMAMRKLEGKDG